jgi:lipopolysaccharide transport system ATP-binding protein
MDGSTVPLIELRSVSKQFRLRQESQRSFQQTFVRWLQGKREPKKYFWPLRDVSFTVEPGESLGIIGANGSGKSTLLKMLAGILEPTSGDCIVRGRVSSLLELGAGFHSELTGRENIYLNASILGLSRSQINERLQGIIDFSELDEFIDVPIKHYSSGMYVRLGFSVAIHSDPKLLLVDEVLAVGDHSFQHKCLDRIQDFRRSEGTLVLVSHDLGTIQNVCQKALWLEDGQIQAIGEPTDVVMAYLNYVARQEESVLAQAREALAHGRRWGAGSVEITEVEICDAAGHPCSIFVTGADLEVRLHYRTQGQVLDPVFGFAIHQQHGAHICGPNTDFSGLRIPSIEGEGVVAYRIPSLPLLDGTYLVSASAHNREDTVMYDYHDRAYMFRVYPGESPDRYGLVTMRGTWSFQPDC